ncbi:MAG: alpha/beta fold hydrolase [Clostridiales bacterium]|nr:alpha/beta fold hydrolase [Clostridiales bacterium]
MDELDDDKGKVIIKKGKKPFSKAKIIAAAVALSGLSAAAVTGATLAYDAIFGRYDRPDYAVTAGVNCISRAKPTLEREKMSFYSDGVRLQGYYYRTQNPKGLTVVCHGIHAGADDYLPIVEYMVESGYSVFSFDYKGTYDSDGASTVGMCESVVDLDHALEFIEKSAEFDGLPITLIGHSWGGYAVASVLPLHKRVVSCAAIAAPNNGYKLILEKGDQYGGSLASTGIPEVFLNVYQKILFGKYTELNAVAGINGTDIPVLIAHGKNDRVIDVGLQSICSHRYELRKENVEYYFTSGVQGGHDTVWHSSASAEYRESLESQIKAVNKSKSMSYKEKVAFFDTIDHRLYSEVNGELFGKIVKMFDRACGEYD